MALSAILFFIGVFGVLFRRNLIVIFMSVELMLNGVNLSFVTFARYTQNMDGHVVAFRTAEPAEVQRPQVAARQLGPYRDQRREVTFALDPVAAFLVLGPKREDDLARLLADEGALALAVRLGGRRVEQAGGKAELQDVRAPVGEVEKRVEVLLHPRVLIPFEASPGIVVDEARRRDARPR